MGKNLNRNCNVSGAKVHLLLITDKSLATYCCCCKGRCRKQFQKSRFFFSFVLTCRNAGILDILYSKNPYPFKDTQVSLEAKIALYKDRELLLKFSLDGQISAWRSLIPSFLCAGFYYVCEYLEVAQSLKDCD